MTRAADAHIIPMERLRQRADFVAAVKGTRATATAFVLQTRKRREDGTVRVGFTVSKKVGNAVERNRVRRRLREIIRHAPPAGLQPGHDYVLIGRRAALNIPFARMIEDFNQALRRVHALTNDSGKSTSAVPHPTMDD